MTDILKERRLINLNSEDATFKNNTTFLSNCIFSFPTILKDEQDIVYVEGGILNAQIPVSFYAVNFSNHILFYSLNSTIFSITVPVGNYNFNTFASALATQFLTNGHTIVITINQSKGIISFTNSTGTLNYFQETGSTIWRVLGFETGTGNFNATANVITPPFLLNLLGPKKLKIFCEAFSVNSNDSKNYGTSSLIDTISVDVQSYGQLNYSNITGEYGRLRKKIITDIDISIQDENNNFINFNNTDWSITLAIIIFRKISISNNDLQPLLSSLGEITTFLKSRSKQEEVPMIKEDVLEDVPTEDEQQEDLENKIVEEPLPNLNTEDLDLLLYENPNFLS